MYAQAINKLRDSIFPIFYESRQGNQIRLGVSGTGFFINNKGLFITANHVIRDVPPNSRLLYAGDVPRKIIQPIEIIEVFRDSSKDVYIGRIENNFYPGVRLAKKQPKIGASICLCGYPLARITLNPDRSINLSQVREYWQPTYVIDYFKGSINNAQYDGFMTQHTSLKGMSGGPVFDIKGVVYGMDVATGTRNIPINNAQPIIVRNGIATGARELQEIIVEAKRRI